MADKKKSYVYNPADRPTWYKFFDFYMQRNLYHNCLEQPHQMKMRDNILLIENEGRLKVNRGLGNVLGGLSFILLQVLRSSWRRAIPAAIWVKFVASTSYYYIVVQQYDTMMKYQFTPK
mmetsp:Transcript_58226/g.66468  ORF Transcript_58226/g.66468 Transcript_58226/m.66468 type:complete len:119 (-) Transcript_58226:51-407(-)